MPTILTDAGTDLYYEVTEDGPRPWIVFLNGMTQSTAHWKSHVRFFGKTHNVLAYDARGQGRSAIGDRAPTLPEHAADLEGLLESLAVPNATLVGFSHGARIALQYENDYHRADRLVLVSTVSKANALATTIIQSWQKVLELGGLEAMSWCAIPDILGTDYLRENANIIPGIAKASVTRNDARSVKLLLEGMLAYPELGELADRVVAETLVISSDHDLLVTVEGARDLASRCGGRHIEIMGCGHTIPIEKPDEFRHHVLEFLLTV